MNEFAQNNSMLIIAVLAIVAAIAVVLTGHATDGGNLLTVLYTVIAASTGGHLANVVPGASTSGKSQPEKPAQ